MKNKDNEFYRWNLTNIMANLLQAEDHLCTVIDDIAPEHAACVYKHLTNAIGETLEASKHCYIADPDRCRNLKAFAKNIFNVKEDLDSNNIDDKSILKVRELRKEFEKIIGKDTSKCELGFCKVDKKELDKEPKIMVVESEQ